MSLTDDDLIKIMDLLVEQINKNLETKQIKIRLNTDAAKYILEKDLRGSQLRRASVAPGAAEVHRGSALGGADPGAFCRSRRSWIFIWARWEFTIGWRTSHNPRSCGRRVSQSLRAGRKCARDCRRVDVLSGGGVAWNPRCTRLLMSVLAYPARRRILSQVVVGAVEIDQRLSFACSRRAALRRSAPCGRRPRTCAPPSIPDAPGHRRAAARPNAPACQSTSTKRFSEALENRRERCFLMFGENVDREPRAGDEMAQNGVAQIDAHQHQRRIERNR